jgi:hypothetical protein
MKRFQYLAIFLGLACFSSCYTAAKVEKVTPIRTDSVPSNSEITVHSFRLSSLQRMHIVIMPSSSFLKASLERFSQEELSLLRVRVKSLRGLVSVNSGVLKVSEGEEKYIDLRKWIADFKDDGTPIVGDLGRYHHAISFVNITKKYPRPDCDIILTIEDPTGLTRAKGLKLAGGFQDSL